MPIETVEQRNFNRTEHSSILVDDDLLQQLNYEKIEELIAKVNELVAEVNTLRTEVDALQAE